jgi:hypothetical protein
MWEAAAGMLVVIDVSSSGDDNTAGSSLTAASSSLLSAAASSPTLFVLLWLCKQQCNSVHCRATRQGVHQQQQQQLCISVVHLQLFVCVNLRQHEQLRVSQD